MGRLVEAPGIQCRQGEVEVELRVDGRGMVVGNAADEPPQLVEPVVRALRVPPEQPEQLDMEQDGQRVWAPQTDT